jgi:hypothetical protein
MVSARAGAATVVPVRINCPHHLHRAEVQAD